MNRRTSAEQPRTAQAPGFAPASPVPQPPKQRAAANKRSAQIQQSKNQLQFKSKKVRAAQIQFGMLRINTSESHVKVPPALQKHEAYTWAAKA